MGHDLLKYSPTSRYPTGKPFRSPGQWGDRCIATVTFGDSGRIDLMWAPAPSRRAGALGGRHRYRGSAGTVDIAPPETGLERHDSHCAQDETYHTASQAPFRRTTWQQKLNYVVQFCLRARTI